MDNSIIIKPTKNKISVRLVKLETIQAYASPTTVTAEKKEVK